MLIIERQESNGPQKNYGGDGRTGAGIVQQNLSSSRRLGKRILAHFPCFQLVEITADELIVRDDLGCFRREHVRL